MTSQPQRPRCDMASRTVRLSLNHTTCKGHRQHNSKHKHIGTWHGTSAHRHIGTSGFVAEVGFGADFCIRPGRIAGLLHQLAKWQASYLDLMISGKRHAILIVKEPRTEML